MKPIRLCLIVLLPFLTGCTTNNKTITEEALDIIEINPTSNENIKLSYFIKITNLIFLETNDSCLIGGIDKLIYNNNKFFLFEEFNSTRALCFGKDGKFLYQIGKKGKAEGEYMTIRDLNLNKWRNRIELYDIYKNKILLYDLNGKYIGYNPLGTRNRAFAVIDSLHYAFFNDAENTDLKFNIFISKIDSFSINMPSIKFQGQKDVMNNINQFYEYNGNILFSFSLNDTIYKITPNSVKPKYLIKYKGSKIPDDILSKDMRYIVDYCYNNKVAAFPSNLVETERYLSISYTYQIPTINTIFYDKISKKSINIYKPFNDINYLPLNAPYCNVDEDFATIVYANDVINTYNELAKSSENINLKAYEELKKICSKINENSNPIIITFKIVSL